MNVNNIFHLFSENGFPVKCTVCPNCGELRIIASIRKQGLNTSNTNLLQSDLSQHSQIVKIVSPFQCSVIYYIWRVDKIKSKLTFMEQIFCIFHYFYVDHGRVNKFMGFWIWFLGVETWLSTWQNTDGKGSWVCQKVLARQ